jgi:hypothetical protein
MKNAGMSYIIAVKERWLSILLFGFGIIKEKNSASFVCLFDVMYCALRSKINVLNHKGRKG